MLLKKGADNEAATAFLAFLKGPEARGRHREVRLRARRTERLGGRARAGHLATDPAHARARGHHDALLLVVGTPIAWWLARSRAWWKEARRGASSRCRWCCRRPCSASICWSRSARTDPAALIARLVGRAHARLHLRGPRHRLDRSIRCRSSCSRSATPSQPIGDRPLEVAATLRASPRARLLDGGRAAGAARASSPARCSASPTRSASSASC